MIFEEWLSRGRKFGLSDAEAMFGYDDTDDLARYVWVYPGAHQDDPPAMVVQRWDDTYRAAGKTFDALVTAETYLFRNCIEPVAA